MKSKISYIIPIISFLIALCIFITGIYDINYSATREVESFAEEFSSLQQYYPEDLLYGFYLPLLFIILAPISFLSKNKYVYITINIFFMIGLASLLGIILWLMSHPLFSW